MRTNITFLLFMLFTAYSHAQTPSWQWAKQVGSAGDNNPNPFNPTGNEMITDVKADSLGNVYAVGYFYTNPIFNNAATTLTVFSNTGGYGKLDAYLIKYNKCGSTLWWRRMGGAGDEIAKSLVLDNNGHVIVAAESASNTYTVGDGIHDTVINNNSNTPIFLAKFDTAGNFIQVLNTYQSFSTVSNSGLLKIFIRSQGTAYFLSNGLSSYVISTLGVITNTYNYVTSGGSMLGIALDKNDNIYLSGAYSGTISIGSNTTLVANAGMKSLIIKFSSNGNMLWYKTDNNTNIITGLNSCVVDTSATIVVVGGNAFNGANVFGYAVNVPLTAATIYYLDANSGNLLSGITGTCSVDAYLRPQKANNYNEINCDGQIAGVLIMNSTSYASNGQYQSCIGKVSSSGSFINLNMLPQQGSAYERINGLDVDSQGNIYIGGMFGGTLDSLGTAVHIYGGQEDGFVAKYGYPCGNTPTTGTVPNAPLALTAINNGSLTNNVTWTDNSNDESNFELHYTFGGNPTYSLLVTLPANTTSYAHTGLSYTTTYCYKVAATNSIGTSAFSNTDCASTPAAPTATSIPNTPLNLTAVNNGSLTNNVAWTDNSSDETNFELHYTIGSSTTYSLLATLPPNTTSYAHTGLTHTTTYCYKVAATNSVGTSAFSNTDCATTPAAIDSTIGIVKLKDESLKLKVYPNPANTEIYFDVPSNEKQITIELYNMLGSLVVSKKNYSNRSAISISTLSKGVYYYKVILPKGEFAGKVILD